MSIRLWNNGIEVHSKHFKWLLSDTKSVLGLRSQFCEVLRYSKDTPEVNNNFLDEQLSLLYQAPSRYSYTTDRLIIA